MSDEIKVNTGVLQGDTLAPFLFIIMLDFALSKIPPIYGFQSHINPDPLSIGESLAFADDIVPPLFLKGRGYL